MAVIEKDGLYQYIDDNGNIYILYPMTKLENVSGTGPLVKLVDGSLQTVDGTAVEIVAKTELEELRALAQQALDTANSKAPAHIASPTDITAGTTALASGTLYVVFE